jgi:hypothetical protein
VLKEVHVIQPLYNSGKSVAITVLKNLSDTDFISACPYLEILSESDVDVNALFVGLEGEALTKYSEVWTVDRQNDFGMRYNPYEEF